MGRGKHTAVQNIEFKTHLTANRSCRDERFYLMIGGSLLISEPFKRLTHGTKMLYLAMAAESGKKSRFTFSKVAATRYGISYSTLVRGVGELEKSGFLKVDRAGKTREYNFYTFATGWKQPPET